MRLAVTPSAPLAAGGLGAGPRLPTGPLTPRHAAEEKDVGSGASETGDSLRAVPPEVVRAATPAPDETTAETTLGPQPVTPLLESLGAGQAAARAVARGALHDTRMAPSSRRESARGVTPWRPPPRETALRAARLGPPTGPIALLQ